MNGLMRPSKSARLFSIHAYSSSFVSGSCEIDLGIVDEIGVQRIAIEGSDVAIRVDRSERPHCESRRCRVAQRQAALDRAVAPRRVDQQRRAGEGKHLQQFASGSSAAFHRARISDHINPYGRLAVPDWGDADRPRADRWAG